MCGWLDLPNRLHQSVSDDNTYVCSRVAVCFTCKLPQVGFAQTVWRVAQMKTEHLSPSWLLWKRDVDTLLKSGERQHKVYSTAHKEKSCRSLTKNILQSVSEHSHGKKHKDYETHTWAWNTAVASDLLRMAASSTQGMLVAPSTRIPSLLFPTPIKPENFHIRTSQLP